MKYFKIIITALVCVGFLIFAFLIRGGIFAEKIKTEMLSCSILEYRSGASIYIAEKSNNSKVLFGKIGKDEIFGIGALTLKDDNSKFSSGFNLYSENESLSLPQVEDVLSISVATNEKYLAIIFVDGSVKIIDLASNQTTYSSTEFESVKIDNPLLAETLSNPPYVYWCNDSFIFPLMVQEKFLWGTSTVKKTQLVAVNPADGEISFFAEESFADSIVRILGVIDKNHILVHSKPADLNSTKRMELLSVEVDSGDATSLISPAPDLIGYNSKTSTLYYQEKNGIKSITLNSKKVSEKVQIIALPKIDKKTLNISDISDIRLTSRGYLFAKLAGFEKDMMMEPRSGYHILLDKKRKPY